MLTCGPVAQNKGRPRSATGPLTHCCRTKIAHGLRVAVKVVTLVCVSCALSGAAALSAALQHLGCTLFTSRLLYLVLLHLFTPTKLNDESPKPEA